MPIGPAFFYPGNTPIAAATAAGMFFGYYPDTYGFTRESNSLLFCTDYPFTRTIVG